MKWRNGTECVCYLRSSQENGKNMKKKVSLLLKFLVHYRGPWTTVSVFNCAIKGSQNAKDPGKKKSYLSLMFSTF